MAGNLASRRMFSLSVVDTDKFLEMPATTQALYFHLGMRADDDGFVSSPKKIALLANCGNDDLKVLASKGYIIPFESGVIVITDWKENNYIRGDRYKPTKFQKEIGMLEESNGTYCLKNIGIPNDNQIVDKRCTQDRLGKDSIGKYNINTICAPEGTPKASKQEINDFFESIWKLYPNKKGKGQVSDSKKKKLYEIGFEELSRAIDRYKEGLKVDEWRKPQNGSTFFNSGYVDYLDANYSDKLDEEGKQGYDMHYLDETIKKIAEKGDVFGEDAPFK